MTEKVSFEDVLDELMLREPKPTYEALLRWSERYPQYREALAQYFATWGIQAVRAELPKQTVIDEERIAREGVAYAMEILRKQGRLVSPESIGPLSEHDQLVLAAVYLLRGEGYPATITLKVGEITGKQALLGSVFVSLEDLEAKALVSSRYADPASDPQLRTRRYFTVTLVGERVLAQAKATSPAVARWLPDFA